MDNALTGLQLVAANGLQQGEGLSTPNISASYNSYLSYAPVNNFRSIFYAAPSASGLTSANANLLISIGSNTFPQLFGEIPQEYTSSLGHGPLFDIAPARISTWFGGTNNASVYINVLGQAQTYAATAQTVISSASTTQWVGNASGTATGGFSSIAGNSIQEVGNTFAELGTLMLPYIPSWGFSNADCFKRMYDNGDITVGNLHLNFFGKELIDPITGISYTIDDDLFNYILDNPVGVNDEDTNGIAALNPLDILLGERADAELTQTEDLDAVVTYFGIGSNVASNIYNWTDCLNVSYILGNNVSNIIATSLDVSSINAYVLINSLVNNISGFTNYASIGELGTTMQSMEPLQYADDLNSLSSPLSTNDIAQIKTTYGNGTGTYGNPTVDDILGSTDFNNAISNAIQVISTLTQETLYKNISSDTGNIANALQSGIPVGGVHLSDGSTYFDINSLAVAGSNLVNNDSSSLYTIAQTNTDVSALSSYDLIAETHNNSITLSSTNFVNINTAPIISNLMSDVRTVTGMTGIVLGIIQRFYGASNTTRIDSPSQMAMFQKFPAALNPSAMLASVPSTVASMVAASSTNAMANEVTGLSHLTNCIDTTNTTGKALNGVISETKNMQILTKNGISVQNYSQKT